MTNVSIIVLTRNRAPLLEKNLVSLSKQLAGGDEIIIINNNSSDKTSEVIKKYQKELPISAFNSRSHGYPKLYNLAASKARKDILVFIDDDCVASPNYISCIKKSHQIYPGAVLQGKTHSLPKDKLLSDISEDLVDNWIKVNQRGKMLTVIDNKNLALPRHIFTEIGGFSLKMASGSEDLELGFRLYRAGATIRFIPKMIVYHHERTTLNGFLKQHLRIARSHAVYDLTSRSGASLGLVNQRARSGYAGMIFSRLSKYAHAHRILDIAALFILYPALAAVRVLGYTAGVVSIRNKNRIKS
jgi:glycosyltransferase involved in cell wall biosynthesis